MLVRLVVNQSYERKLSMSADEQDDIKKLSVVYEQLCATYHAIRDFRAKLLGLLPLASGGGIFLLLMNPRSDFLIPIGLVGVLVTVGLSIYEIHNMQRCRKLIERGTEWESMLTRAGGQFRDHPVIRKTKKTSLVEVAACFVYGSVLAGWLYVVIMGVYYLF